ncbi:MAG TPA: UDP-3-O-acyl-N-acetylglucosamine deacetylase [Candidatus Binataceae bacterium]|nr:UDP-3-O-acyl-N-acetylglucosamine deacetylase [Candidatus Binataceae bacterium]
MGETVLVVDDEERIRSSLKGILSDEGFRVLDTGRAPAVMDIIAREHPRLVLLDVWMPDIDGIELLRLIKAAAPQTEVIMISGHGNINSAVAATKLGAADFIEKPFSVDGLLSSIARALLHDGGGVRPGNGVGKADGQFYPDAAAARGTVPQRTIKRSIVVGGQGLHTGLKTGVILHQAQPGAGISFTPLSGDVMAPARVESVTDTGYNTTLSNGGYVVRTVEHLMSALHGFGITNLLVKTHGEVPALDGSALEFCRLLADAGVQEQRARIKPLHVERPIVIGKEKDGGEYIRVEPADHLIIDYTLIYPKPIGTQRVHFELTSPEDYVREIAPARTFGFLAEMRKLSEMGLANGGRLDNVILVDDEKVVNTKLRFPDEFARHKILDLIGDLYLLGRPIIGHITACKTGHSDNLALVRRLLQAA